jgi:hypothetical protein
MPTSKRKNRAAVTLGRLRQSKLSAAERSERARQAVSVRWHGKPKPKRWWVLFALDDNHAPQIIDNDTDREKLLQRARTIHRQGYIDYLEYNPSGFTLTPVFEPDTARQTEALVHLAHLEEGGQA